MGKVKDNNGLECIFPLVKYDDLVFDFGDVGEYEHEPIEFIFPDLDYQGVDLQEDVTKQARDNVKKALTAKEYKLYIEQIQAGFFERLSSDPKLSVPKNIQTILRKLEG